MTLKELQLQEENSKLKQALLLIYNWDMPECENGKSFGYNYGSNGERDHIRSIAANALHIDYEYFYEMKKRKEGV